MSDETEFSPTPFALPHLPKGNLLHTRDVAKLVARPGEDTNAAVVAVRNLVMRGYLFPVARDISDARNSYLFSSASALSAAALLAATDTGLNGVENLSRLAHALQVWHGRQPQKGEPINAAALMLLVADETDGAPQGWSLELHVSRNAETGDLFRSGVIRHGDHGFLGEGVVILPEGHSPVGSLIVPLDDIVARVLANLRRRRMA